MSNDDSAAPLPIARSGPSATAAATSGRHDGRRDFDFLHGRWSVHNRRLRRPLSGSTEWMQFEGTSVVRPFWSGDGHLEEWEADAPSGRMRAVSLHLYDPNAGQWRLHWATRETGRVGVPTVGYFVDERGQFFGQEDFEDRAVLVRLIWQSRGPGACRFEQAFSDDGGRSWETNWVMDFTRET
jgi:hypothetical protein